MKKAEKNVKNFNVKFDQNSANCLGYLITTITNSDTTDKIVLPRRLDPDTGRPFNPTDTPVDALVSMMEQNGIILTPISSLEEAKGKRAILLWGWCLYFDMFGKPHFDDFHVAHQNDDGSYDHKPDGHRPAEVLSEAELQELCKEEQLFVFLY